MCKAVTPPKQWILDSPFGSVTIRRVTPCWVSVERTVRYCGIRPVFLTNVTITLVVSVVSSSAIVVVFVLGT